MGLLIIRITLVLITGYLLGSLNTSIIVGKCYGVDIRKHGSGNAGMTNTLRNLGKTAAALVVLGDILKGVLSFIIGNLIVDSGAMVSILGSHLPAAAGVGGMFGGIAAIAGHNWPLYFGFKGGKGILTSFSVVMMMDWQLGIMLLGLFLIVVIISRYVSLSSIIACAVFPAAAYIKGNGTVFTVFALIVALLAISRHHANIKRLINGTEPKIGKKNKDNSK
ncbi:glycerol-3-phosphate acyltransferase PlsY [Ruminiclostridium sufflavum DSM 19573]|uniref:Glycerol-3-phosphate acyltransferase n=1 Tax=Ruminiclostridium sufflavum DSM 19573 TaxID=1121337 RepID=A0A318XQI8_9FIRM|nr:glycerol-3-phosphate 1-O-acyltransferase PlsY [Ruminiclostridium sufflavum]PYG89718.1 glycerol-3-phosphate acyltransferase PlsY [Ruminiclostridium sufflavum DSM 19573]